MSSRWWFVRWERTLRSRLVERYVAWAQRAPVRLLLFFVLLTAAAIVSLTSLRVTTDLRSLLPDDAASVTALEEAEVRRGSSDLYTIAVQSPDPAANAAFLDTIAARIETEWDEALWVQVTEDTAFFRDHALLYLPVEQLERLRDDLDRALDCELADVHPLVVRLSDEDCSPSTDWSERVWFGDAVAREVGLPRTFFEQGEDASVLPEALQPYLLSDDGTIGVLYVQLDRPNTEIDHSNRLLDRGRAFIAEVDPASFHPDMRAEVVGAYRSLTEAREVVADSLRALLVSAALVVLVVLAFFRDLRGLLLVLVPLLMGVAWTLGLTGLIYPELTLYTLFVGSILVGLGIDYGVHLYARARESMSRGSSWDVALVEALTRTGRAIVISAITTVGALVTLIGSQFRGFVEFGVVASYGVLLCALASVAVLPPLLALFERVRPIALSDRRPRRLLANGRVTRRFWLASAALVLVATVVTMPLGNKASFEYDFRNYRGRDSDAAGSIPYERALGGGRATAPAILLGDSPLQMQAVHAQLQQRMRAADPTIQGFLTLSTFVPNEQADRLTVVDDIRRLVGRRALNRLTGDARTLVEQLRELADVSGFERADVPAWALRILSERDGSVGRIGLVFRAIDVLDMRQVEDFRRSLSSLSAVSGPVPVAFGAFLAADIVDTVQKDGRRIAGLVGLVLTVVLLLTLRDVRDTIACLTVLAAAFSLTLTVMALTDTKLGLFNMIVIPAVVGVSIDGAVHLIHRVREEGLDRLGVVLRTTGVSVLAASLTTIGGFTGLLFQSHQGIASIGKLAVIGFACTTVTIFGLLPGLLVVLHSVGRRMVGEKPAASLTSSGELVLELDSPDRGP